MRPMRKPDAKLRLPCSHCGVQRGAVGKLWNVLEVWRQHASSPVEGRALDAGHYLAEEQPEEVLQEFLRFFRD
jgi:haloacetate dehalogenase